MSLNWVYNDLITHALHPFMNLYEGNVVHKWSEDYVHGSASHNTGFRNYIMIVGDSTYPYTSGLWAVSQEPHNYYSNVVGNVLGQDGLTDYEGAWNCIYKLGYNGEGATRVSDRNVKLRVLRQSNYDTVNRLTLDPDSTLPESLYHADRPSFFAAGDIWPPIGASEIGPVLNPIPAQNRYTGGTTPTEPLTLFSKI